jgi:hypothetical protein
MNINTIENDLSDVNGKFSLAQYEKLKPNEKLTFKNQLKATIEKLKKSYVIAFMDDHYLFELAGAKANFTIMQMVNDWKELSFRKKTSAIQGDAAQQAELMRKQKEIRVELMKKLFGSADLFNKVNEKTIAIDQAVLQKIVG